MTQATIQMTPGDDTHLTLLMAPQSLNFCTGQDREHLLAFGRAAFAAGQASKCLLQIAEPATAGTAVRAFRDYLGVHDGIKLGGQAMDDMALDLARIAPDFKHLVEPQHPDDAAVDALAVLMKAKLAKQRGKGYSGWDTDCTQQHLSNLLRGHVDKGDPVDVANFCAFLLARGEGIAAAPQAVQPAVLEGWKLVPTEPQDMQQVAGAQAIRFDTTVINKMWTANKVYREMIAAAPAHPAEGVPAQFIPKESVWPTLQAMARNYKNDHQWDDLDSAACSKGAEEIQALRALSVTNILLKVVPGLDGMGHEVRAKSVKEVEDALTETAQRLEDWELGIKRLAATQPAAQDLQRDALKLARDRLADMLKDDDGQAWKEARKAMPIIDAAIAVQAKQMGT